MNEKLSLTIKEASEILGASQQFLRVCIQQNRCPFGFGKQNKNGRWSYYISKKKLEEYLGKEF